MKILLTGLCGFAGSVLARELRRHRENLQLCGIDNLSRQGSEANLEPLRAEGIDARIGDVRRPADLAQFEDVDWLIDAAANPSVLAGVDGKTGPHELLDHNLVGTIPMLEFCRERSIPFTLLSTSRVYSIEALRAIPLEVQNQAFRPQTSDLRPLTSDFSSFSFSASQRFSISPQGLPESFPTDPPLSLYGASKRCAELLALEYGAAFQFPVWINRCGVLAGAGQFGKPDQGIFSYWIHSWARRRPLKYLGFGGTGHQVRDCLHPRDLVPLLLRQFDSGTSAPTSDARILNVSGGAASATSLAQLSDWCSRRLGPHEVISDGSDRPFDLPWVVLDHTLATECWNWTPATPVADILEEIAQHAERNPNWLDVSN